MCTRYWMVPLVKSDMKKHPILATSTQHLCRLVAQAVEIDGPQCDLNHIDVSRVQEFNAIFAHSPFDGEISCWDVSNAVTFANMFAHCPFNGSIAEWNVGNALNMEGMFLNSGFQGDISQWDVSGAACMEEMFQNSAFNGDLSKWNVSHVLEMNNMFKGGAFDGDISSWDPAYLREARGMFDGSAFHGDVSGWKVPKLNDARSMFNTPSFHGDLSGWRLSSRVLHDALVHPTFCGALPTIEHYDMHDAGAKMLGGVGKLNAYALRAPFSPVHAQLLLADPTRCSWASREDVRWAQEMREMGRAMGMDDASLRALMVEKKRQSPTATTDGVGHLFECK